MNKKTEGVTDIIANLATEDEELRNAAIQLNKNRSRETNPDAQDNTIKKTVGPKLVPPTKKTEVKKENKQPKETNLQSRSKKLTAEKQWSNPTATLNTRIPPEMDQLLDDHVAKQKRRWKLDGHKGTKPTKQTLVQSALELFFRTNKI